LNNKRMAFIVTAIVVVLLVGTHVFLLQMTSPDKIVNVFVKAVEKNQPELLNEIVIADSKEAEVSKESLTALTGYLQKNHNSYQVAKESLTTQIERKDFGTTNSQISLTTDGKKWGIYPVYKLKVKTGNVKVSGQNEDDEIQIQFKTLDHPVNRQEEGTFGPVVPGIHDVVVTIKNALGTVLEERQIEVWGTNDISVIVDPNKLIMEDEKTQKEILVALDTFNHDYSKFTTSEFTLSSFSNISEEIDAEQLFVENEFALIKEYIDEIQSQYLGAIVNLDELEINYFNGNWSAEIAALVSYKEKIKFRDYEKFDDASFKAIRNYTLTYDAAKKTWLITGFTDTTAQGSEADNWKNKQDISIQDPPLLKWNRTSEETNL